MAAHVIRTINTNPILFYSGCSAPKWQKGFPEIFSSWEQADKVFQELKKKWSNIEIVTL